MNETGLSPKAADVLQNIQTLGTSFIQSEEQIGYLIQGLLKTNDNSFNTVMPIIQEDKKLCIDISKRMSEITENLIRSNNQLSEKAIESYKGGMEAIERFMENPTDPSVTIKDCFIELRFYAQKIEDERKMVSQNEMELHKREQELKEKVLKHSESNRNAAIKQGDSYRKAAIWTAVGETALIVLDAVAKAIISSNNNKR